MTGAIALATISLDRMAGGLERNIVYLANHLAEKGEQVVLLSFDRPDAEMFFDLHPAVVWRRVGASAPHQEIGFAERLRLIGRIRRTLAEFSVDVLICFHHGILARFLAASVFLGVRIVCSERNSLTLYRHIRQSKWNLNFLLLFLVRAITVQFPSYVNQYPAPLRPRIRVIHNPVHSAATTAAGRDNNILSVGRYAAQKRFDALVEAFARATRDDPSWTLTIVGDGPLKSRTEDLVRHLGIADRVTLAGPTREIAPYYARARFYCQPSQWEGFPNALAEAMAAGVIPIGHAQTSGVADLIQDGTNGILAAGAFSVESLTEGLERAIRSPEQWDRLSDNAREISRQYSSDSWGAGWESLLADLRSSGRPYSGRESCA